MNILLTGATGFIGSHLVKKLLKNNHQVIIITRPESNLFRLKDIDNKIINIKYNESLSELIKIGKKIHIDALIHLATFYKKIELPEEKKILKKANVNYPLKILKTAIKLNIPYFINTGTCFEYKPSKKSLTENNPIKPFNYYAKTKIEFENKLKKIVENKPIKALTLKLFFPYGEMDNNNKLIPSIINSILNSKPIYVTKGEQILSYTYVEDITNAYLLSLDYIKKMKKRYDTFLIGGEPIKLKKIFFIIEKITNSKNLIIKNKPYQKNEIMYMFTHSKKAKKILGWKINFNIEKGLKKIYNFYQNYD